MEKSTNHDKGSRAWSCEERIEGRPSVTAPELEAQVRSLKSARRGWYRTIGKERNGQVAGQGRGRAEARQR